MSRIINEIFEKAQMKTGKVSDLERIRMQEHGQEFEYEDYKFDKRRENGRR